MSHIFRALIGLCLITTLFACARFSAKHAQLVTVTTQPEGASCVVKNKRGDWSISSTPAAVAVERSSSNLHIHCRKDGYVSEGAVLIPHLKQNTLQPSKGLNEYLDEVSLVLDKK